ncbi:MAG: 30S ribosome-binding factor RbfA [Butyrivibrio sp.]|nr:30S ribosome-binding factor RbfA [Butyrivibrio sp.]
MRKNSIKNIRINGEVMRVISEAIRFSKDPRISPMTSVMEVEVAPDLKTCKVWVSVLGDDMDRKKTMEGLQSATGYIRSTIAKEINLRNTPTLKFIMDDSIEYAINMSKKIDEVTAADAKAQEARKEEKEEEE